MKKFNYENKQYLDKLDLLEKNYYSKYISFIGKYLRVKNGVFLDVGCGNGSALTQLNKSGYKNGYGVDVSKLFVKAARKKNLKKVYFYDGINLPFENNFFDLIGSFNVLEHTNNPSAFLRQQLSKIKKGGYLIIACPNFLSVVMNSPHRRIKGLRRRTINFFTIIKKLLIPSYKFEKMPPIFRENFEYDDDAIVVTNLVDLKNFITKNRCKIVYESGFINYDNFMFKLINAIPVVRYMLPSCFIVAQKNK